MVKTKQKLTLLVAALTIFSVLGPVFTQKSFADADCNTKEECQELVDEAQGKADEAKEVAKTLQEEVARLSIQISELEDQIEQSKKAISRLSIKITENELELKKQQAALAQLLVEMHFEEQPSAFMVLASSSSISDYAEKQSRNETVEEQVVLSSEAIKLLKEQLEKQKTQEQAALTRQREQQTELSETRLEQGRLVEKYKNDADSYGKDAEEARKKKQEIIEAEMRQNHASATGVAVAAGSNSYPWRNRCPRDNLGFFTSSGYGCQCTSYAGYKATEYWGVSISAWGDAKHWGNSARAAGYTVNDTPAAHTVGYSTYGTYGHVVWIEKVNADGTVDLSEYNNAYSSVSGQWGDFGYRINVPASSFHYIHFGE